MKEFIKNLFINNGLLVKKFDKEKVEKFLKKIKIIDSGHKLIRIGANSDGGYLLPNILDRIQYCFSPGVGNSTTFEDHLLKYNIKSFLVDGTVNYNGKHDFLKKNLNCFNNKKNITLEDWVNKKIYNNRNNKLLLQMDIEGSEIEVLNNVSDDLLNRFKIIIIEFHHFEQIFTSVGLKIYNDLFDKILKTHNIVHIHPNNSSQTFNFLNNKISALNEITFINKKDCKYVKKIKHNLPHILDHKCAQSLNDIKCPEIFYK
jgi:hypothetical protein